MVRQQQQKQQKREAGDGKGNKPPAVLTRMVNGTKRRYKYLKTVHSVQELDDFRFEYQCAFGEVLRNAANFTCIQMRCHNVKPERGGCPFALLACRPPGPPVDKNHQQIHVYASSRKHNHRIAPAAERAMSKHTIWSDEEPPAASFSTSNGREWIYMETTKTTVGNKALDNMLEKRLKRKYHCRHHRDIKHVEKRSRITLYCTGKCNFAMMAQRTDRDRFHLYASECHTCLHKNKVTRKSLTKGNNRPAAAREEEENEEEEEGEQQEGDEQEEDEMEEEESDEEDDDDEMEDGDAVAAMPAAMISNVNNVPVGRKEVEFIDFVDHPENGGLKLRRLGELKKEAGAPMITMNQQQEEKQPPANNQQNRKAPKREIKEEEPAGPLLDEEQRKEHRKQQNAKYAHGTPSTAAAATTMPTAMINVQQNHQQQTAMNRRRAEEVAAPPNNNGQQRLLRERKGRINYRE